MGRIIQSLTRSCLVNNCYLVPSKKAAGFCFASPLALLLRAYQEGRRFLLCQETFTPSRLCLQMHR